MTEDHTGQPIYPISGWDIGPSTQFDGITIRLQTLDLSTRERQQTSFMALTRPQIKEFQLALAKAVAKLDGVQTSPDGKSVQ